MSDSCFVLARQVLVEAVKLSKESSKNKVSGTGGTHIDRGDASQRLPDVTTSSGFKREAAIEKATHVKARYLCRTVGWHHVIMRDYRLCVCYSHKGRGYHVSSMCQVLQSIGFPESPSSVVFACRSLFCLRVQQLCLVPS